MFAMSAVEKLALGTVQWGVPYGLYNQEGMTSTKTVKAILDEALAGGIHLLDTASLYGESEAVLGRNVLDEFRIVTKTPKFQVEHIERQEVDGLVNTFRASLKKLNCASIYGLLIHDAEDILKPGGLMLIQALVALKMHGLVDKIGVSVYDGKQVTRILKIFTPDIVQLPISILDQRVLRDGTLDSLYQLGVEVHARSVFLQGLLLMPADEIPIYFNPIRSLLNQFHMAANDQNLTAIQASLTFVRDLTQISKVLVGVQNLQQFQDCARDFKIDASFEAKNLNCDEIKFVNPSMWNIGS